MFQGGFAESCGDLVSFCMMMILLRVTYWIIKGNVDTPESRMECRLHAFRSRSPDGHRLAHDALDLLQRGLCEVHLACLGALFELVGIACADDGHIDAWLGQHPRNRQLRHAHAFMLRQALQVLYDCQIALKALAVEDRALAAPVVGGEGRLWREGTGQQSMRQRAVDEHADPMLAGVWEDGLQIGRTAV